MRTPRPTGSNAMPWNERLRSLFRGELRAPEPARPDYNEQPSADEAVRIPVGLDGNPIFRPSASLRTSETQTIDWQRIAEQVQRGEHRLDRARDGVDHAFDAWRYAQQAPQPSERSRARERLRYAAERLRSGVVSTPWHEAPEWLSHRKNELVELPYIMEYGSVCESLLRWEGSEYVVLPTISLKTGQVEYKKGSPEPQNGKERTECEEFAMKEIRKWEAENKTLAAMA